jgi:hypothetical protein
MKIFIQVPKIEIFRLLSFFAELLLNLNERCLPFVTYRPLTLEGYFFLLKKLSSTKTDTGQKKNSKRKWSVLCVAKDNFTTLD